jgi:hypothetical protein
MQTFSLLDSSAPAALRTGFPTRCGFAAIGRKSASRRKRSEAAEALRSPEQLHIMRGAGALWQL